MRKDFTYCSNSGSRTYQYILVLRDRHFDFLVPTDEDSIVQEVSDGMNGARQIQGGYKALRILAPIPEKKVN